MNLSNKIEKYLPSEYKNLNSDEKSLLMDDIFKTESCSDCSYFRWGKHDENREYDYNYKEDKDGEIACCNLDGILSKLDFSPGADSLSAKEALRWWFGEGPGSLYLDRKCGGYDGGVPYLKKEMP